MKRKVFTAELLDGHKGPAVLVPFDPEEAWGIPPRMVANRVYGARPGHLVRGTLDDHPFEGWIGHRWGNHFILVDEALRKSAGLSVGKAVRVAVEPRGPGSRAKAPKRPRMPKRPGGRSPGR